MQASQIGFEKIVITHYEIVKCPCKQLPKTYHYAQGLMNLNIWVLLSSCWSLKSSHVFSLLQKLEVQMFYGLKGQNVLVPVDLKKVHAILFRSCKDEYSIFLALKRQLGGWKRELQSIRFRKMLQLMMIGLKIGKGMIWNYGVF